jgi:hypothetical protein
MPQMGLGSSYFLHHHLFDRFDIVDGFEKLLLFSSSFGDGKIFMRI